MNTIQYKGGPLDGATEKRHTPPRDAEPVHRLIDNRYVQYVFDLSRSAFVFIGYL